MIYSPCDLQVTGSVKGGGAGLILRCCDKKSLNRWSHPATCPPPARPESQQ